MNRSPHAALTAIPRLLLTALASALVTGVIVLGGAAPALAHDALRSSGSAQGAVAGARPEAASAVRPPFVIVRGQQAGPPSPQPSDRESATTGVAFPVWLIIVVGGLAGVGIGFLLSMRKKKP
ncbi:hypothetical protein [Nonomuraea longicatena]|uniref:Uncharacterized protein n=1 Tax=Nonomuraea longicatena TaxID=83682 RepID=A0ABN1QQA4_9ACTN